MKYKIGDEVRVLRDNAYSSTWKKGDTFVIYEINEKSGEFKDNSYEPHWVKEEHVELVKEASQYDILKSRIEAIEENTTVKEWDKLLVELYKVTDLRFWMEVYGKYGSIVILSHGTQISAVVKEKGNWRGDYKAHFEFSDFCSKGKAHKDALMWLLDHSSIKNKAKQDKIVELNKKLEEIKKQLNELK